MPKEEEPSLRASSLLSLSHLLTRQYDHSVAATSTPIIFIGTGEHLHDLETFSPRPFISKMLGMGDMQGLIESAKEMQELNPGRQEKMMEKFEKGEFSVRDMREQMMNIMSMYVHTSSLRGRSMRLTWND